MLSLIAGCCSPKTHSLVLVGLDAAGKVVHRSCACPDLLCAAITGSANRTLLPSALTHPHMLQLRRQHGCTGCRRATTGAPIQP